MTIPESHGEAPKSQEKLTRFNVEIYPETATAVQLIMAIESLSATDVIDKAVII